MERSEARPDDEATLTEARSQLRQHLERLPDELRTALVLRFQENWTFAQIASEQSCSEPSAHDRVRRGLERLRGELSRAGFAGFAALLPQELALEPDAAPRAVPAGLERQLLGLRASALSASAKFAAGALALVSIVAVATAAAWRPAKRGAEHEVAALTSPAEPQAPRMPAPGAEQRREAAARAPATATASELLENLRSGRATPEAQDTPTGTLAGRCVDEHGAPVAEAVVLATSLQHDGKFARFAASGVSGADGRFQIAVPVSLETGEEYVLSTRHLDFVPHVREHAQAKAGATAQLGDLSLRRSSSDVAGDSTLDVLVLDDSGAPVEHATVTALRSVAGADGALHDETEATGRTDHGGRVALELKRLGTKRLHVFPLPGELGGTHLTLGIDAPGRYARTVQLERGLTISGTITGIGGTVTHGDGGFLAAFGDPQLAWIQADIDDASGAFVLRGLEDRTYTLVHDGDPWSRAQLENVRAGTSGLAIQLKRESDVRDIGDHQAELHGEVRDARTGEVLTLEAFAVDAVPLGDVRGLDWERDILPGLIFPRPVQTCLSGEYVPPQAFHLEGLQAGTWAISVRIEGYAPAFAGPFELAKSELRAGIVIRVEPPAVLRGVLVDPRGKPLAHGFARLTGFGTASEKRDRAADDELRATRGRGAIGVWDDVPTDEQGRFEFKSLPALSALRLVVHHPDHELAYGAALELKAGETTDIGRITIGARR